MTAYTKLQNKHGFGYAFVNLKAPSSPRIPMRTHIIVCKRMCLGARMDTQEWTHNVPGGQNGHTPVMPRSQFAVIYMFLETMGSRLLQTVQSYVWGAIPSFVSVRVWSARISLASRTTPAASALN